MRKGWLKLGGLAVVVVAIWCLVKLPVTPDGRFVIPGLSPGTGYWEFSNGVVSLKTTGMPVDWAEIQGTYGQGWLLRNNGSKIELRSTIFYVEMIEPGPPVQKMRFWRMWMPPRHERK